MAGGEPPGRSSPASLRRLLVARPGGTSGSPWDSASTSLPSASTMPGRYRSIGLRPAPPRRTLPSGTDPGSSSSRLPADAVALDTPASAATAVRPPRPSDSASAAR